MLRTNILFGLLNSLILPSMTLLELALAHAASKSLTVVANAFTLERFTCFDDVSSEIFNAYSDDTRLHAMRASLEIKEANSLKLG